MARRSNNTRTRPMSQANEPVFEEVVEFEPVFEEVVEFEPVFEEVVVDPEVRGQEPEAAQSTLKEIFNLGMVQGASAVNLRSKPATTGRVLTSVKEGTALYICAADEPDDWKQVRVTIGDKEFEGYMMGKFLVNKEG